MPLVSFKDYIESFNKVKKLKNASAINLKIAVLRSFTCEMLEIPLTVEGYNNGYDFELYFSAFGQYAQEILDINSRLYDFLPNFILVAINIEDIGKSVFKHGKLFESTDIDILQNDVNNFIEQLKILRSINNGVIFVNNFFRPLLSTATYHDANLPYGTDGLIRNANSQLIAAVGKLRNVYIYDLNGLIFELGARNAFDYKQWYIAKNLFTPMCYIEYARAITGMISAVRNIRKKCIVLDLDNTLWRGVIGEDGMSGIDINDSFKDLQRQLLFWKNSGILLAVNSKNNYEEAMEVIEKHPDMILRKDDFASFMINWEDKASNIRKISNHLNIMTDSMVFIDDSAYECDLIKCQFPEIDVIHLDGNYAEYANTIRFIPLLNFISITEEDKKRTDYYRANESRTFLLESAGSLETYLESLGTEILIKPLDDFTLTRASQLSQKTNQFNLTSGKYAADDLTHMNSTGFDIYTVSVSDKYGDSGITGLIIVDVSGANNCVWHINNFLLSCRVMGRGIEKGVWSYIVGKAYEAGIKTITGEYVPTKKNKPVEHLLETFGFQKDNDRLKFVVSDGYIKPDYIKYM